MLCPNSLDRGFICSYFSLGKLPVSSFKLLLLLQLIPAQMWRLRWLHAPQIELPNLHCVKAWYSTSVYWEELCKATRYVVIVSTGEFCCFFDSWCQALRYILEHSLCHLETLPSSHCSGKKKLSEEKPAQTRCALCVKKFQTRDLKSVQDLDFSGQNGTFIW